MDNAKVLVMGYDYEEIMRMCNNFNFPESIATLVSDVLFSEKHGLVDRINQDVLDIIVGEICRVKKTIVKELNFADDDEKMIDFLMLSKEEFLQSYSYLTEAEYDATEEELKGSSYQVIAQVSNP